MANNLYEEAINAAEQIKEAAESKVKQQLVEALSPKIKQLIEKSLLDEMDEVPPDPSEEDDTNPDDDDAEPGDEENKSQEECGMMEGERYGKDAFDFYANQSIQEVEISAESANILNRMIGKKNKKSAIFEKFEQIQKGVNSLKKAILIAESSNKSIKFRKKFKLAYENLLRELKNIGSNSIIKTDKTLLKEYLKISKELKNMSRRRKSRKNYLNESLEDLLEMNIFEDDDDEELDDDDDEELEGDVELEGDDELELDLEDDIAEEAPSEGSIEQDDLAAALEPLMDLAGIGSDDEIELDDDAEEFDLKDDEEGEEEEELEGEDDEEEELEGEEEEELELEAADFGLDEDADIEEMHETRRRKKDLFLEIDENMLKKEIKKMKRLREGEASAMASHFGGGSLDKEMFVDVDDGDLNVHAGVLGREDVPTPKVEAALRKTMRKNRMLESKIRQFKNAVRGMKTQLSEMNLFNAKLLYANKLMQNRDLSIKQQRHIVESLDEAGTLNEAKLLFESLSKSLSKPARRGRKLSEGTNRRTLSSASRSTKSAQPINENVALDRWATLAGIKK
jgi:hypothetical protein